MKSKGRGGCGRWVVGGGWEVMDGEVLWAMLGPVCEGGPLMGAGGECC